MSRPCRMRYAVLGTVLAAVLLAAGCADAPDQTGAGPGGDPAPPAGDAGELRGRTFTATVITERGAPRALAENTRVQLRFTDDDRLVANAGCNTMSGAVTVDSGTLDARDLSITEMGCDPPRHEQDQFLSAFLTGGPSWQLDDETLVLSSADTEVVLMQEKALPLLGTTWRVDTLVQGDTAGSTPAGVEATFVFGPAEVTITGLCNLGGAKYQGSGSTMTFDIGAMTLMACSPEIMTVENAAIAVLDGETTYKIDTNTLTITNGNQGLRLIAQA